MDRPDGGRVTFASAVALVFSTAARHWRTCLPIAALYAVPWGVANAVWRSSTRIVDPLRTLTTTDALTAAITGLASIGAMVVIALFLGSIAMGGLSLVGSAAVYGDVVETRGIIRRAFDRALDAVAANLLVLLLLSIGPVVAGISGALASLASSSLGFAVLVFATIFVIIVDLYLVTHLLLAVPVVMREARGAVDALRRSWSLIKGAWLWVLGIVVVLLVVPVVVQRLAESAIGRGGSVDFVLWALASTAVATVSAVLFGVGAGVVYASRAPEDVVPPDVAASERRADGTTEPRDGATERADLIGSDTQDV